MNSEDLLNSILQERFYVVELVESRLSGFPSEVVNDLIARTTLAQLVDISLGSLYKTT